MFWYFKTIFIQHARQTLISISQLHGLSMAFWHTTPFSIRYSHCAIRGKHLGYMPIILWGRLGDSSGRNEWPLTWCPFHYCFFHYKSNLMEISLHFSCITVHDIVTNVCSCSVVVSQANICTSYPFVEHKNQNIEFPGNLDLTGKGWKWNGPMASPERKNVTPWPRSTITVALVWSRDHVSYQDAVSFIAYININTTWEYLHKTLPHCWVRERQRAERLRVLHGVCNLKSR